MNATAKIAAAFTEVREMMKLDRPEYEDQGCGKGFHTVLKKKIIDALQDEPDWEEKAIDIFKEAESKFCCSFGSDGCGRGMFNYLQDQFEGTC